MKFKLITTIILIITILNINSICFAKYVFDYTEKAAELNIDRTPPILKVEYSNLEATDKEVEVIISANEKVQEVEGWTLLEDQKTLVKKYDKNSEEVIKIKDLSDNQSETQILIKNIDKEPPIAEIVEIKNTNTGYENYANKTHELVLKVKISDKNQIISNLQEFNILVGTKENLCTKEIKILEQDTSYIIYQIKLTNIENDGELVLKIAENSFEDIAGNKIKETKLNTGIIIDNICPVVEYRQEILENGKVLGKIISNEAIRTLKGWKSEEDNKINLKEFISDIQYERNATDLAGNISNNVEIKVQNATFLGLEYMAHISENGWTSAENHYVGIREKGNIYKIESLAFRTSNKVESDFLKVSAYAYTYWGPGSTAKAQFSGIPYNYGYNPINGYKTMDNSQLVTMNNKQYILLAGEGINGMELTDVNGNNPIPREIASQYRYGISGVKLNLKDNSENSIIYQIFFNDTGWQKVCKNGEEAMMAENKPIEAIRIAVVPTSELEIVMQKWNQIIGTYNLN